MKRFAAALLALFLLSGCTLPIGGRGTTVARPVAGSPLPAPGDAAPAEGNPPEGATPDGSQTKPREPRTHVDVRGLYMTGYIAGGDKSFHDLLDYMKASGLNAAVIDIKDDDGLVTFKVDVPAVQQSGANKIVKVSDMPARVKELHDNGFYVIGRIVTFVDPVLAKSQPDLAVQIGGKTYYDRRNLPWTNPYKREVWDYNVEIAKAGAAAGFDEIQFDYVRFPEKHIEGLNYGVGQQKRVEAISGFLKYAHEQLKPLGVFVSADVFGLTTTVVDDMMIGQNYRAVAETVDYISPMVYPSHYNPGIYGLKSPNASPYETVYNSMLDALRKADGLDVKVHRPWIQDFSLGVKYGKPEVEAQIKALGNAGVRQFILWDPNNKYTRGVDYGLIETTPELPRPEPEKPEQEPAPTTPAPTAPAPTIPATTTPAVTQ